MDRGARESLQIILWTELEVIIWSKQVKMPSWFVVTVEQPTLNAIGIKFENLLQDLKFYYP